MQSLNDKQADTIYDLSLCLSEERGEAQRPGVQTRAKKQRIELV